MCLQPRIPLQAASATPLSAPISGSPGGVESPLSLRTDHLDLGYKLLLPYFSLKRGGWGVVDKQMRCERG